MTTILGIALALVIGAYGVEQCSEQGSCQVPPTLEELGVEGLSYLRDTPLTEGRALGAKFRNFLTEDLVMYWDNGSPEGTYSGVVSALAGTATNSYEGHTFIFRKRNGEEVMRHTMEAGRSIYIIPPVEEHVKTSKFYKKTVEEMEFVEKYYKENGTPWLSFYPRGPPVHHMWSADYLGQVHHVETPHGYLSCSPKDGVDCHGEKFNVTLTTISLEPRIFLIEDLLSEYEIDHILKLGKATVSRSTVGQGKNAYKSSTRTSATGWLRRDKTSTLNHIFGRFSSVLNISNDLLTHNKCAENLQIVHYQPNQYYAPHHDFGDSGSSPSARYLTLFIYIKAAEKEGGTSFPKAFGGRGLKVLPKAGSAILWYNMLPDGNGDDLSLHSGMHVEAGEKWGANLWVWDPLMSGARRR